MTRQTVTQRARGREHVYERSGARYQIVVPCTKEQRDAIRANALKNCRAMGQECLFPDHAEHRSRGGEVSYDRTERPVEFYDEMPPVHLAAASLPPILGAAALAAEVSRYTESPIETMLGVALLNCNRELQLTLWSQQPPAGWLLVPQMPWRKYRIDWAIISPDQRIAAIECDGNEFHTAEDAIARDHKRDAAMQKAGLKVYRFTGSDIWHGAAVCAWKVVSEFCR